MRHFLKPDGSKSAGLASVDGELIVTETEREENVFVRVKDTIEGTGTGYFGLIDKSDTVNWPHEFDEPVHISTMLINIDKGSNVRGSLEIGVIVRVDETDADVEIFDGYYFTENSSSSIYHFQNYAPTQFKTHVADGRLAKVKTNSLITNIAAINTAGGDLVFNGDTFTPSVGDIVLRYTKTAAGTLVYEVQISYHTHLEDTDT